MRCQWLELPGGNLKAQMEMCGESLGVEIGHDTAYVRGPPPPSWPGPISNTSNIHGFISCLCLCNSKHSPPLEHKTISDTSLPLVSGPHIPSSHPMGRSISATLVEPLVLCFILLLKVGRTPPPTSLRVRTHADPEHC